MVYESLASHLREPSSPATVTALPDGSIDVYYRVLDRRGGEVASREAFGERVLSSESESIPVDREFVDVGGQAVNVVRQATANGDDATVIGFLDDARFETLDAERVSMGPPATVFVYEFTDMDLLLADSPAGMADWGFDSLVDAAGENLEPLLTADAVCVVNWVSFDGMTDALSRVAERDWDGSWLLLDPGDVTSHDAADVSAFLDTFDALESNYDVVLSANEREAAFAAEVLGVDADAADAKRLVAGVREETGATGVVLHGRDRAVAAAPGGTASVPTLHVESPARRTGGGDTFDAGLVHGLTRDWSWPVALAFANVCASYYVEHGERAGPARLRRYLTTADVGEGT